MVQFAQQLLKEVSSLRKLKLLLIVFLLILLPFYAFWQHKADNTPPPGPKNISDPIDEAGGSPEQESNGIPQSTPPASEPEAKNTSVPAAVNISGQEISVLSPQEETSAQTSSEIIIYDSIPILMYHVIEDYSGTYEELYVPPLIFRQQLAYLKENGYHTVTCAEVLQHWSEAMPLPDKPIVLSFDDGYRSMYTEALPLLKEYGFRGTFFLHLANINTEKGLTEEMIQEMITAGMEIGSHTVSHPDLTKLTASKLKQELEESKRVLSEITGTSVHTLAYPSGRFNKRVMSAARETGYLAAVTTQYGPATSQQNIYSLKRIRINKSDGVNGFIKKIQAAVSY